MSLEFTFCKLLLIAADCGDLTPPSNGSVAFIVTTFGNWSVASFSCDTGYILYGDMNRTCQSNGTWSGSAPTCEGRFLDIMSLYSSLSELIAVDCGDLTPPSNGSVAFTFTTFGNESIANYSCDTGYILYGDMNRTCQSNGTWSGSAPTCEGRFLDIMSLYSSLSELIAVDCGDLTPPSNGSVAFTFTTFGNESIANYSCDTGYILYGDMNRTCQSNGTWSGSAPTCEGRFLDIMSLYSSLSELIAVDCGDLTPPSNGSVAFTFTTFGNGSIANYSCDTGYILYGDMNRTCQSNGTWSGSAPTCEGRFLDIMSLYSSLSELIAVDCGDLTPPSKGSVAFTFIPLAMGVLLTTVVTLATFSMET